MGRVHFFHHRDTPGGVVCHIVLMVDLAVQQLQIDDDVIVFGNLLYPVQPEDYIFCALFVRHALAVA